MADTPKDRDALILLRASAVMMEMWADDEPDEVAVAIARATLAAEEAAGLAVVPVEATDDMVRAAIDREDGGTEAGTFYHAIYAAAVSASPYTSKPGGDHA